MTKQKFIFKPLSRLLMLLFILVFIVLVNVKVSAIETESHSKLIFNSSSTEIKGDGFEYDKSKKVLTLNQFKGSSIEMSDIDGQTIILIGNNIIETNNEETPLYSKSNLMIIGTGTLTIKYDDSLITDRKSTIVKGIDVSNGALTINGNINLNVHVKAISMQAIVCNDLNVSDNANIDVKIEMLENKGQGQGIYATGDINITGAGMKSVTVTSKEGAEVNGIWQYRRDKANSFVVKGNNETGKGNLSINMNGYGSGISSTSNYFYLNEDNPFIIDGANIEINNALYGIRLTTNTSVSSNGKSFILKNDGNLKIISNVIGSRGIVLDKIYGTLIENSKLYIDIKDKGICSNLYNGGNKQDVEILGSSRVDIISENGYAFDTNLNNFGSGKKTINLSKDGYVKLVSKGSSANYLMLCDVPKSSFDEYIKIGNNTKLNAGYLDDGSTYSSKSYRGIMIADNYGLLSFVYSEDINVTSIMTSNITITGTKGAELTEHEISIEIENAYFKKLSVDTDVTEWFPYIPKGLNAVIKNEVNELDTKVTIKFYGNPDNSLNGLIYAIIPSSYLNGTKGPIYVHNTTNKFDIVDPKPANPPKPPLVTSFEYDGTSKCLDIENGTGYTIFNPEKTDAGTYKAYLTLNSGYYWSDGTTDDIVFIWTITPKKVEPKVTIIGEYTFISESSPIIPKFKIEVDGKDLYSKEYTVEYENNYLPGEAILIVKSTDEGNYTFETLQLKYTINKKRQGKPTDLKAVSPTEIGKNDGKIFGVSEKMEYSLNGVDYLSCTGSEILGLSAGIVYVRYKEDEFNLVSESVVITIASSSTITVRSVSVTGGTGSGEYEVGKQVTISAVVPSSMRFEYWMIINGNIEVSNLTSATISFIMPDEDVIIQAIFVDKGSEIKEYNIVVQNGSSNIDKAKAGTKITINAIKPSDEYRFVKWEIEYGNINLENETEDSTSFVMPLGDVKIVAVFEKIPLYDIIINGKVYDTLKEGIEVNIKAYPAPEGKVFLKWVLVSGLEKITDEKNEELSFIMPGTTVNLEILYKDVKQEGEKPGDDKPGDDKPGENKGLKGGAIAGIVIASVFVAGIGGFALVWFVIKKKSFADLKLSIKLLFKRLFRK